MARNLNIDLIKIVACINITCAHLSIMGYLNNFNAVISLAVFFFISGFLVLKSINHARRAGKDFSYFGFLWYKIKSFLPYLIASELAIVGLILYTNVNYYHNPLDVSIFQTIMTFFGDISCLSMFGMSKIQGNVAVWYLSGMLVAIAITYPFIIRYREKFTFYMSPLIAIFAITYMLRTTGTVLNPFDDAGELSVILKGTLTSLAFMCLGYFAYECGERMRKINFTRFGRIMLAAIEIFIWIFTSIVCELFYDIKIRSTEYSELMVITLTLVGCIIVFSQSSAISYNIKTPRNEKIMATLMQLSFILYLCQYYQMYFASRTLRDWSLQDQYLFIVVSIALSMIFTYFVGKGIIKLCTYIKRKMIEAPVEPKMPETS